MPRVDGVDPQWLDEFGRNPETDTQGETIGCFGTRSKLYKVMDTCLSHTSVHLIYCMSTNNNQQK